jgi:acyl-CoA hydrolase
MGRAMTLRTAKTTAKRTSAAEAAGLVRSGMWLDFGVSLGQPEAFDVALAARAGELADVSIRSCVSPKPHAFRQADPEGRHFNHYSWFFSAHDRRQHDEGVCSHIPLNLGEVPDYYRRFIDRVDMAIIRTRPKDEAGMFNFGPTNVWHRAIVERAEVVIVEVSEGFPHVFGDNGVHESEVDYVIEGDGAPAMAFPNPPPGDVDRAVARLIAAEVQDRVCLQIGIGGMPNAVCSLLRESGVRDIGVHTEMLTEGIVELYNAGCVTGSDKTLDPGKVVFTFALGAKDLYDTIDRNSDMLCMPVDYTNMPHIIMQNDNVVSINSTTQIDLQGQAASESDGHRHISGTGGQLQFVRGAYASKGGKSFICLPSTYERKGVRKSRIVLDLTPGNIVTTPRSDVMYVVTEYGMVNLKGRSVCERAGALIDLAHPDFREELERAAHEHGLLPRSVAARSLA